MIPTGYSKCIQIEVTNACQFACSGCTRHVGHHAQPFFMSLEEVENALKSLEDFPGHVGMMGGEPAIHPKFREICKLYQEYIPVKARRQLWTAGHKWKEYYDIIHDTFYDELINYNDHSKPDECWHQPLLIAIEEVIKDKSLMWKLIDNCWVQNRWSPSITPKGGFFCEVAAAKAHLFGGEGWPIERGWWDKNLAEIREQAERYCPLCSACLPMEMRINSHENFDWISPGNFQRLADAQSPRLRAGQYQVCDCEALAKYACKTTGEPQTEYKLRGGLKDLPEWTPWNYRSEKHHEPGEGDLTAEQVRELQGVGKNK
jgi:hypothetical protein